MNSQLSPREQTILKLINSGHNTLCNIVDYFGEKVPDIVESLERLEILGYIAREAQAYNNYWCLKLTTMGTNSLEISDQERALVDKFGISAEDLKVLKSAKELGLGKNHSGRLAESTGYSGMQLVTFIENLENKGLVKQRGIIRRYLQITPQGETVLQGN